MGSVLTATSRRVFLLNQKDPLQCALVFRSVLPYLFAQSCAVCIILPTTIHLFYSHLFFIYSLYHLFLCHLYFGFVLDVRVVYVQCMHCLSSHAVLPIRHFRRTQCDLYQDLQQREASGVDFMQLQLKRDFRQQQLIIRNNRQYILAFTWVLSTTPA